MGWIVNERTRRSTAVLGWCQFLVWLVSVGQEEILKGCRRRGRFAISLEFCLLFLIVIIGRDARPLGTLF